MVLVLYAICLCHLTDQVYILVANIDPDKVRYILHMNPKASPKVNDPTKTGNFIVV